jgi:hypothetical protein
MFMNKPMGLHIHSVKSRSKPIARLGAFSTAGDVLGFGRKWAGQECGEYYRNNRKNEEDSDREVSLYVSPDHYVVDWFRRNSSS